MKMSLYWEARHDHDLTKRYPRIVYMTSIVEFKRAVREHVSDMLNGTKLILYKSKKETIFKCKVSYK